MAELPLDQAVPRFKANEDRLDTFVNSATGYTTSGGTSVQSIQQFLASIGSNGIDFVDNAKARFGTGNDLEIYHSGSGSFIRDTGTGDLTIDGSAISIQTASAERVSVSATGINVTGTVEFDGLSGTGAVTITDIADEDNMASNSATKLATQQSIKAYVDAQVGTADTLSEVLGLGNTTGSNNIEVTTAQKVQFRDSAIYINSSADGQLDLVADTEIQIAATTVDVNGVLDVSGNIVVGGTVDGRDLSTDGTKLDGIEAGATADQTAAQIKTAYESNSNTNAFTDADHTKLDGIATGADVTLDQISAGTNVAISAGGVISATASGGITNVVDDTSPELGGDLTLNSHDIIGTGNIDITGNVQFDGLSGTGSVTITDILDEDNMASNSATKLATQQSIKSYVDTQVATIPTGDITSVVAGTGLTGGGTSGAVTLNLGTAGAGAGTYGSTSNTTKIDQITLDAYGRITAVTTGATGDITGVTAGTGLTGGGTSGTVTLNVSQGAGSGLDADTVDGKHTSALLISDATSNSNLNTAQQSGVYRGGGTLTNAPSGAGGYGTLLVANNVSDTGFQMYVDFAGNGNAYIRGGNSSTFGGSGSNTSWAKLWSDLNDGSGSGLDADTLDGIQGASYLRSDTTDYMNANLVFADNARLQIGTNTDLQLFHDGNDSYIREAGTGVLFMDSDDIHFRNGAGTNTLMQLSSDVLTMQGQLQMNGNIINDVEDIYLRDRIYHDNDTDNYFQFSTDTQNFVTGGNTRARINGSGLTIYNDLYTPNKIIHSGDTDTYTQFHAANEWRVVAAGNERLEVRTDGVLVSTTFTATGDVIAYGSSDKQLKDNIKSISNAMDKISKLSGNTFDWNDKQSEYAVGTSDVGVIAQEVEAVLPEVVTTRDNGYKAVRYEKIIALLIEGMKEQQTEIDMLKAKVGDM